MTHPSAEDLESYRRRRLARGELLAVDAHIASCEECRRLLAADVAPGTALRRAFEAVQGEHPTYEQIEGYVDRRITADERAIVAEHASLCAACASEIEGLEMFRREHRQNWRWWAVAAAAAAALVVAFLALRTREAGVDRRLAPPLSASTTASTTTASTTVSTTMSTTMSASTTRPPAHPAAEDPVLSLSPSLRRVALALESGRLTSAALLASLQPPPEGQRTSDARDAVPIRVVSPVGIVVETNRPSFRWERSSAGEDVTVQIYDNDYGLVAESPHLNGTSWQVPTALDRGATYRWQLRLQDDESGTVPAPPDPPALFHVIAGEALEELTSARESGSALDVGLICMREGLVAEGAQSLALYAAQHPESPVAAQLSARAEAQERALTATSKQGRTATSSTDG